MISKEHIDKKLWKVKKKYIYTKYYFIPRSALLAIYEIFICTHLDYGDVIYGQTSKACF